VREMLEMREVRDVREARELHAAAALLSASVLADSALEHHRGAFENPAMVAPLVSAALALRQGAPAPRRDRRRSARSKQSALVIWIPRALAAGAEVRDLAMVGRIESDAAGRASGVHHRRGEAWRLQRAKNVVVAGYAIETPRLLLSSACKPFPQGLANGSGLVGTHLTTHAGPGAWATFDEEIRWYKGPPNMAVCEHWNYVDRGKDFHGGEVDAAACSAEPWPARTGAPSRRERELFAGRSRP